MPKVRLPGTHRAADPQVTWDRIKPLLGTYGVTRVADVTGLDNIGIPVALAIRPGSETLAVSQGKGATPLLSTLSAVMESIELWHAERPLLNRVRATEREFDLPYELADLTLLNSGLPAHLLPMEWISARGLLSGADVKVPLDVVRLSFSGDYFWRPRVFQTSSTGLASGNTFEEACLHGLYEAVERDVLAGLQAGSDDGRVFVDPATIDDEHVRSLLSRLDEAGVDIEIVSVPNRYRIPVFAAFIWSPLFPLICAGAGAHSDAAVALARAITEAVQSRLTEISSTRDDIASDLDLFTDACTNPEFRPHKEGVTFDAATHGHGDDFEDLTEELLSVSERVRAETAFEPLVVDLSTRPDTFSVVRVVCPGFKSAQGHAIPR